MESKGKLQKILSLAKEIVKIDKNMNQTVAKKNMFLRNIEKRGFIKNLEPIPATSQATSS